MSRRYTKQEKLATVMAVEVSNLTSVSEQTGIPKSTIEYWLQRPEFAQFRTKAREELAESVKVVAHLAWQRVGEALAAGSMKAGDMLFAAEKATNLLLLLSGEATSRTESRDLTGAFDDHELDLLKAAIDAQAAASPDGEGAPQPAMEDAASGAAETA